MGVEQFKTGARRDTQENKPHFEMIPIAWLDNLQKAFGGAPLNVQTEPLYEYPDPRPELIPADALDDISRVYAYGAEKYGINNYLAGMPASRMYASLPRHIFQWAAGDTSEQHLRHAAFNIISLIQYQLLIERGELPGELWDMPKGLW